MVPKSSPYAGEGSKANRTTANANARKAFNLVCIIVVFLVGRRVLLRRLGLILLLVPFVVFVIVAGNPEVPFERSQLIWVDESNNVHNRELLRFSHEDHHTGDRIALL